MSQAARRRQRDPQRWSNLLDQALLSKLGLPSSLVGFSSLVSFHQFERVGFETLRCFLQHKCSEPLTKAGVRLGCFYMLQDKLERQNPLVKSQCILRSIQAALESCNITI